MDALLILHHCILLPLTDEIKSCVCVEEVTYRCSRVVDQEAVDLEILDIGCKVDVVHKTYVVM